MTQLEYFENKSNITKKNLNDLKRKENEYIKKKIKLETEIKSKESEVTKLRGFKKDLENAIESIKFRINWTEYGIEQEQKNKG